jgi:hypothetical protein
VDGVLQCAVTLCHIVVYAINSALGLAAAILHTIAKVSYSRAGLIAACSDGVGYVCKTVKHTCVHSVEAVTKTAIYGVDFALDGGKVGSKNMVLTYAAASVTTEAVTETEQSEDYYNPKPAFAKHTVVVGATLSYSVAFCESVIHKTILLF